MRDLSLIVAIYFFPVVAPAVLMILGHYFPWQHTTGGKLTENQARIYGVLGIIVPVMASVAISDTLRAPLSAWQVIGLVWIAAISAGASTIWVWSLDEKIKLDQKNAEEQHRAELMKIYAEDRNTY